MTKLIILWSILLLSGLVMIWRQWDSKSMLVLAGVSIGGSSVMLALILLPVLADWFLWITLWWSGQHGCSNFGWCR